MNTKTPDLPDPRTAAQVPAGRWASGFLIVFFLFAALFPTIRILLIGSRGSVNMAEMMFSVLPEIIFLAGFGWVVRRAVREGRFAMTRFDWAVAAFIVFNGVVGTILTGSPLLAVYGLRLSYLPVCAYFLARWSGMDEEDMAMLLRRLFNWFALLGASAMVLYFGFRDAMKAMIRLSGGHEMEYFMLRMTGIFWSPVVFGTLMSLSALYYLYRVLDKGRPADFGLMALCGSCLLLSITRGAFLSFFFGAVFLLVTRWRTLNGILAVAVLVGTYFGTFALIGSPWLFGQWIRDSALETMFMDRSQSRVRFWQEAMRSLGSHPWGFGLGRAGHVAARFFGPESTGAAYFSTDGWFLKLACETGFAGLASYLVMGVLFMVWFIRPLFAGRRGPWMFIAAVLVTINVQNYVSNVLDFYLVSYLYWLLFGLLVAQLIRRT